MTRTTLDGHVDRISRAEALVAGRLHEDKTLTLDEPAAAAAISKFHFHRVFRLLTGETCAGRALRLQLAAAAQALAQPDTRITEAALPTGHLSSQAFAKALKDELTVPAQALRADPERLAGA